MSTSFMAYPTDEEKKKQNNCKYFHLTEKLVEINFFSPFVQEHTPHTSYSQS